MNRTKKLQISLVVTAVLCAIGIAASLIGGDDAMPRNFRPPWWISALDWLAFVPLVSKPTVAKSAVARPDHAMVAIELTSGSRLRGDK